MRIAEEILRLKMEEGLGKIRRPDEAGSEAIWLPRRCSNQNQKQCRGVFDTI
jgi:hypothetical protein